MIIVTGEPVRDRQVEGRDQRPRIVLPELFLETGICSFVRGQRLLELTERPVVGAQAARRHQGMRVVFSEHGTLFLEDDGVEFPCLFEAPLRPQHVCDVEPEMQGLLVVGAELVGPEGFQPAGQAQTGLEVADLPLVPHPVDEQLTGPRVVALLAFQRNFASGECM